MLPPVHRVLLSWVGRADLRAVDGGDQYGLGPIGQALAQLDFDEVRLLCNYPEPEGHAYLEWIRGRAGGTPVGFRQVFLSSPTDFADIHEAASLACREALEGDDVELNLHLSPGTPAMQAVWVLLGKSRFPAKFIESSPEQGARFVSIPFDIAADFVPAYLKDVDERAARAAAGESPPHAAFVDIIHRSPAMRRVIAKAQLVAPRNVSVLIEGESGTGKELLAKAIHAASPRDERDLVSVNCGAIPPTLLESELFGHKKGTFTGANSDRIGHFERANGSTLFLDEVGELPLDAQVKLLRVLQEKEVIRIGTSEPIPIDVRIIAATNRSLIEEVEAGRFREDLFYRLAVAVLRLPPIREREGDLALLVRALMEQVNKEAGNDVGLAPKELTPGALRVFLSHPWKGNVRELLNTLRRCTLWSTSDQITETEALESLHFGPRGRFRDLLHRPIEDGVDLPQLIVELKQHYMERALAATKGNRSEAARLCGLPGRQTLTNWMKKHGVS